MKKQVDLSVVIPSFNTRELLQQCLESIKKTENGSFEIETIVVDNASTDRSVEMVKEFFPDVVVIHNKKNLGFAKASNQGWRKSRGKFVLFLNSDTVVGKTDFKNVLSWLMKQTDRVGGVSGKLTLRSGKPDPDCHRGFPTPWNSICFFLGLEKLFPTLKIFSGYHQGWKDLNTIHEIDSGCGAFLVVKRDVLEKLGGYDESYFFYGEDIDLCYRIKEEGYKIYFYPHIKAIHYKGASSGLRKETQDVARPSRESLMQATRGSINAWKRFYNKFYKLKYPKIVTSLILLAIEVKGLIRIIRSYVRTI